MACNATAALVLDKNVGASSAREREAHAGSVVKTHAHQRTQWKTINTCNAMQARETKQQPVPMDCISRCEPHATKLPDCIGCRVWSTLCTCFITDMLEVKLLAIPFTFCGHGWTVPSQHGMYLTVRTTCNEAAWLYGTQSLINSVYLLQHGHVGDVQTLVMRLLHLTFQIVAAQSTEYGIHVAHAQWFLTKYNTPFDYTKTNWICWPSVVLWLVFTALHCLDQQPREPTVQGCVGVFFVHGICVNPGHNMKFLSWSRFC